MVVLKARINFLSVPKCNQIFPLKGVLLFSLIAISTSSPQVNHKIYSEEDLLAIDSSPHVETFSDAQGTAVLPPPAFQPTGKRQSLIPIGK